MGWRCGSAAVADELGVADQLGCSERHVEGLAGVETGVAHRLVAVVEMELGHLVPAADAFGDVVTGELDVDAPGPRALRMVCLHESLDLAQDGVEAARLAAARTGVGVAVHGIARPDHWMRGIAHCSE